MQTIRDNSAAVFSLVPVQKSPFHPVRKWFYAAVKIKVRASRQPYQMIKSPPHIARQSAKKDVTPYAPLGCHER